MPTLQTEVPARDIPAHFKLSALILEAAQLWSSELLISFSLATPLK